MKRSEAFRAQARNIAAFRDAYMRLISLSAVVSDPVFFTHRAREPKKGMEGEFYPQFADVARLAGKACVGPISVVDEIANWQQSLKDVEILSARDVVETCESMLGILDERATVLDQRDRTLAGKVALFVGFPARVRAIVVEDHPGLSRAAFGVGIAGQVLVGVIVAILAAGIFALVASLGSAIA
jgi:hypothetical protein